MNLKKLTQFVRRNLKTWGIRFLISCFSAFVILLSIVPVKNPELEGVALAPDTNGFKYSLNLISPAALGVDHWQIGDYTQYRYHSRIPQIPLSILSSADTDGISDFSTQTVAFHIIDELEDADSHRYWLKITGMFFFREFPGDIYQLVTPNDMRMTSKNRRYEFLKDYVPSRVKHHDQSTTPLAKLVELGQDEVETQAGRFECVHYRAELGPNLPVLEIWANPKVRPLGIVRVQSQDEVLELTSFGQEKEVRIPKLIQPVIQGISVLGYGCTSCHGEDNCHESIFPPK